jgi:hypothetical protein
MTRLVLLRPVFEQWKFANPQHVISEVQLTRCFTAAGRYLLFQNRRRPGCGRHSRGSAGRHHHLPCSWHPSYGQEERHRPQPAVRRDSRLHFGDLLGQDGNPYNQPDVSLSGEIYAIFVHVDRLLMHQVRYFSL